MSPMCVVDFLYGEWRQSPSPFVSYVYCRLSIQKWRQSHHLWSPMCIVDFLYKNGDRAHHLLSPMCVVDFLYGDWRQSHHLSSPMCVVDFLYGEWRQLYLSTRELLYFTRPCEEYQKKKKNSPLHTPSRPGIIYLGGMSGLGSGLVQLMICRQVQSD